MCWRWRGPSSPPPSCCSRLLFHVIPPLYPAIPPPPPPGGFGRAAKQLLHGKALDFEEIDVAFDEEKRVEMIDRAMGLRTVPQIFIHGRHVGGYDELAMLEREGKLDAWLAAAPQALADAEET